VIQNVLALTYWAGGYFYEQQAELSQDEVVIWLCKLAKSKGKVTLHFLLAGFSVLDIEENQPYRDLERLSNLSQQPVYEMCNTD